MTTVDPAARAVTVTGRRSAGTTTVAGSVAMVTGPRTTGTVTTAAPVARAVTVTGRRSVVTTGPV
ncbi:hypothetical protein, partial [Streptomyces bohaiensis]|uniref:hypothetical protein n=1 Tax=Streptomyces bohaiensis TaxID=1431344 RepID=UPI0030C6B6FD